MTKKTIINGSRFMEMKCCLQSYKNFITIDDDELGITGNPEVNSINRLLKIVDSILDECYYGKQNALDVEITISKTSRREKKGGK